MDDLISRQAAIDALTHKWDGMVTSVFDVINSLPSAQPERKTGKWIHQTKFGRIECDQCGKVYRNAFTPKNYCPNCGARMVGEGEEHGEA